jgi:hypothetical protein
VMEVPSIVIMRTKEPMMMSVNPSFRRVCLSSRGNAAPSVE